MAELLISVVILSFGLVAIVGSFLVANRALSHSQNRLKAIEFLRGELFLLKQKVLENGGLEPVQESIDTSMGSRACAYKLEVVPLVPGPQIDLSKELNLVKLSLSWKEANIAKDVSVWTCLERKQ